jgi:hypothetical protein
VGSQVTSLSLSIEWQAPASAHEESRKLGWLDESVQEGQAWLKAQRGYADFRKSLDIISGRDIGRSVAEYRSHVSTNRLKRNISEIVNTLAKLRPMWGYHSDNKAYKDQAEMMNKVTRAWYLESFADISIKEALQYAAATGRGWVVPVYRRDMFGTGRGDIKLLTYGAPCVLPNQLPASGDWQSAYVVHILDEMPVAMAHGMFPAFQHRLRPSSSRYWYANDAVRKAATGNLWSRMFGRGPRQPGSEALSDLLVPIRRSYIIDLTVNTTKAPIPMGEPGSSWAYTVPYLGQDIPVGTDPRSGTPLFRKADENDARLYPYRRLIISSDQCVMYDGPGFDWHGMFPGISFQVDAWPWEPLGFSLARDGYEIQQAINEIVRGNQDKVRAQLDMSLAFDTNAVASKEAKEFDPMRPRGRIGYDGSALEGQPFQPVVPEEVLKVTPESFTQIEYLESTLDAQQAVKDAMALARMRAVGSMDELEKVMEATGPIIEGMSRAMEPPMRDLGVMIKYLILQYYTTTRVMQIVGADGVTPAVFDYDPTKLVPSHMPSENVDGPSPTPAIIRARTFADNLRFFILPNSLHEMTQMTMKLGLIQLKKAGVKIDSQTIAEAWQVPNYGDFDGNTVVERWKSEQEADLEFAAKLAMIKAALGGDAGGQDSGGVPGQPPGAAAPGKNAEGRPNANTAPAKLEQKDGGARSTISTSK